MKNTSKVKVYLINAYSNYIESSFFISGSDKVAIEFAKCDPVNSIIIGPSTLKQILPKEIQFYSSQNKFTKNLIFDYFIRTINTIYILRNLEFCDYIISSSDFFCDVIPGAIYSFGRKWFVFTYHLYPSFEVNKKYRDLLGKVLQDFSYFLYRFANKIFTSNIECVSYLSDKFSFKNILKIPLGVSLKEYSSLSNKEVDVLFLGRIKESKGVFDLPEIVSLVRNKIPNLKVCLIGNGPDREKKRFENLNHEFNSQIEMLGSVEDQVVKKVLSNSKILIQLDSENGFGLNIVEALASGCFVVGYDLPSYRDNFKNLELLMSPQKDKNGVSENIISILKNNSRNSLDLNLLSRFDWKEIYKSIFRN